jgi:ketosteroid isomerase-like protein
MAFASPRDLVQAYVAAAQRARSAPTGAALEELRSFLADDITIRMASPWTDAPWRTVCTSADALISRLQAPINQAASLTTENVNVVEAGGEVFVEQLSTISRDGRDHVSMVCHIFTVVGDRITAIRAYRNDLGVPAG